MCWEKQSAFYLVHRSFYKNLLCVDSHWCCLVTPMLYASEIILKSSSVVEELRISTEKAQ